jgi:hypothetical protein
MPAAETKPESDVFVPAQDQNGHGLEFTAKLSPDRKCCLIGLGRVQLELPRGDTVRLAQTLLAMASVMVEE